VTTKRLFRRIIYLLPSLYAKYKLSQRDNVKLMGFSLAVAPSVFHPQLFFSSKILAQFINTLDLKDRELLDMGTGSGLIGLCAASRGASVLGVDINPAAVENASANVKANGLEHRMRVIASDLFTSVPTGKAFDYIVWNPPFYPSQPDTLASLAWRTGKDYDVIDRFAKETNHFLRTKGSVLLILSSDMQTDEILRMFSLRGFSVTSRLSQRKLFEIFTVYEFSRILS
jgi:release factor glutamine methyltransferase